MPRPEPGPLGLIDAGYASHRSEPPKIYRAPPSTCAEGRSVVETRRRAQALGSPGLEGLEQFTAPFKAGIEQEFLRQGLGMPHIGVGDDVFDLE